jgi:hypothetical protein
LKRIDAFNNKLTGTIPSSITKISVLQIFHLKDNKLTGTIPGLGSMQRLSWVDLSNNMLHGTIPQSFGTSRAIEDLRLGGNFLYEPIPRGLCKNPSLNGGATKMYGCDGVLCPIGTYSDAGHAMETQGCIKCPDGKTTLYLGSSLDKCRTIDAKDVLTMFFEVMQGDTWPEESQKNWGDPNVDVCSWSGISCNKDGELIGMGFPLVGLDEA